MTGNTVPSFFTMIISIFILLNSFAQVPVFVALLGSFSEKRQKMIIIREMLLSLVFLILFILFGNEILSLIGLTESVIGISGGLLLILIALNLIFPKESSNEGSSGHEPFFVPLAVPGIAGPGTLTAVMLFAKQTGILLTTTALIIAWIPSFIVIFTSAYIKRLIGEKGLIAIEKLGGMLIVLIGVKMLAFGIIKLVKESF